MGDMEAQTKDLYLEMEDTCIVILETLSRGDHPAQESGIQSEGGSGRKKPAVTWEEGRGQVKDGKGETGSPLGRGESEGWTQGPRSCRSPATASARSGSPGWVMGSYLGAPDTRLFGSCPHK